MARSLPSKAAWAVATLAVLGSAGYLARDRLSDLLPVPATTSELAPDRPAQPVRVTRVVFESISATASYTGTVRPQREAELGFRVAGKIVERLVEVGDRVAEGQTLARLDDTDARLELEVAKAEEAAARTDLARAEADAVRSRDLFAAGHVAQSALDRATSAAAEARSRTERAARASALAANSLSYTILVAEANGVVTATPAEAGQVVAVGQSVISVARTATLDVVFALPEQDRALLDRVEATAELWGSNGTSYALTLRDISPDVDPAGRTYRVRMAVVEPDADAALGRTATVRLVTGGAAPAAPLPLAAVLNDGAGPAVWRLPLGADRVERVSVELVTVDGQVALVRGGLVEGDVVISLGAHKIDPSRPVRVVETTASPES